jgi:hypothetical protein
MMANGLDRKNVNLICGLRLKRAREEIRSFLAKTIRAADISLHLKAEYKRATIPNAHHWKSIDNTEASI